jgi:UDP-N-acetylglucosamine--N-acetylmuramyl-(pentapeptide) pyrophosphoryl-undecaprenol N-acetylglucosamine transferase
MPTERKRGARSTAGRGLTLIAAGGTGGHIFPGIAVAEELRRRDPEARVIFVGTRRGLERRLVPQAGYELLLLPILPLNGVGWPRMILGLAALPWGLIRALGLLLWRRPSAVLGIGGYAGGPIVLMAALFGIRTVILEPNVRPGFTNRLLRPFARHAACAYAEARSLFGAKGVLTGNPVRPSVARVAPKPHVAPLMLLAFGGSQGSRTLNQALVESLPYLPAENRLRIVHQTGPAMHAQVVSAYAEARRPAEILPFLDDMDARYRAADLVFCRAGATTCAELAAAGKASVLVPFARATGDHQRVNALAFANAGAAVVIAERDLTGEKLAASVRQLIDDPHRITDMEKAARVLARPDAAKRVADLLEGRSRV